MLVYALLLGSVYIVFIPRAFKILELAPYVAEAASFILPLFMGFIVEFTFPLANRSRNRGNELPILGTGSLYFYDLFGGAFVGILLNLIFIPLHGLFISVGIKGKLFTLAYNNPVSVAVDSIEKKPFFHVLPGTGALSIAVAGCNLLPELEYFSKKV